MKTYWNNFVCVEDKNKNKKWKCNRQQNAKLFYPTREDSWEDSFFSIQCHQGFLSHTWKKAA